MTATSNCREPVLEGNAGERLTALAPDASLDPLLGGPATVVVLAEVLDAVERVREEPGGQRDADDDPDVFGSSALEEPLGRALSQGVEDDLDRLDDVVLHSLGGLLDLLDADASVVDQSLLDERFEHRERLGFVEGGRLRAVELDEVQRVHAQSVE